MYISLPSTMNNMNKQVIGKEKISQVKSILSGFILNLITDSINYMIAKILRAV
jgi:hypothetical protein